jgi:hypothetical protein
MPGQPPTFVESTRLGKQHVYDGKWANFNPEEWIKLAKTHPGETIGCNYTGVGRAECEAILLEIRKHTKYDGILVTYTSSGHTRSTIRTLLSVVEMVNYNNLATPAEQEEFLTVVKYVWSIELRMVALSVIPE